jgi:serine-type D-Ala-D-Ala carboxypeptidase/endopeptidase (penicillin-binding protein 4)
MMKKKLLPLTVLALSASLALGFVQPSYANPDSGSTSTVACKANKAMRQETLGKFNAYVINVESGKVLVDLNGKELTPSASVIKTLTAVAALQTLPEDYRASTQVLFDPLEPDALTLRGGGDFTLTRLVKGQASVYTKPARLRLLARQALAAIDPEVPITKIYLDSTFFEDPTWNPDWPTNYLGLGYVSHITALQLDGDRVQPNRLASDYSFRRGSDPVLTSGKVFRKFLGARAKSAELIVAPASEHSEVISEVFSQSMRENWLGHMLTHSDNTASEFIALHAAKAAGLPANFSGSSRVIKRSLRELGLKPKTLVIRDASGLSNQNRVHARLLARLMVKVAKDEQGLGILTNWMPIAGQTGTLRYRFQGKAAIARGKVIAKTGYIPGLYGLSGIVNAQDGSTLAFAVFARADSASGKSVTITAQPAIDRVVTRFYLCGASLTQ